MTVKFRSPLLLAFAAALIPFAATAASFDCAKARSYAEKLICSAPDLSLADEELGRVYRAAKKRAGNSAAFKKLVSENWKKRERCADEACVRAWYRDSKALYEMIGRSEPETDAAAADDSVLGGIVPGVTDEAGMRRAAASIGCRCEKGGEYGGGTYSFFLKDAKGTGNCLPFPAEVALDERGTVFIVGLYLNEDSDSILKKIRSKYRVTEAAPGDARGYRGRTGVRILQGENGPQVFYTSADLLRKKLADERAKARADRLF